MHVSVAGWQGSRHPGRLRRGFAKTAESRDQAGETQPSKAAEAAVLEPADDGLVDTAENLEFALRQSQSLASAKDQVTDQPEPMAGFLIGAGQSVRFPGHVATMAGGPYRAISRTRDREGFPQ